MRILYVLGELKPSGAETMLVSAAPLLRAGGLDMEVLSTGKSVGPYAENFAAAGFRIHHIPFSRSVEFFSKVRRLMRVGRYDVIHLHVEAANFWLGIVARSVGSNAVLRTVHSSFKFSGNLRWRRLIQRRLLRWLGIAHVAISASVKANERERYGLKTVLIQNWFDSRRFVAGTEAERAVSREKFGLTEHDFVLACIGNCSGVKNHAAVVKAIALLPSKERPIILHAGIEDICQSERDLARQLGIEDRIRFLGGVEDVLPLLRAANAFVMPSLYEGFGIAAVEALGAGLPSLLSDVSGLKDFRESFPHLVYCGHSPGEVADGIRTLTRMPDETKKWISDNYPCIASQRFGLDRGVKAHLSLYRGLLRR